jgi:mannose-6-phosphate isomerase class I
VLQVLSINKALPLQAHPTNESAAAMHAAKPDVSAQLSRFASVITGSTQQQQRDQCKREHVGRV